MKPTELHIQFLPKHQDCQTAPDVLLQLLHKCFECEATEEQTAYLIEVKSYSQETISQHAEGQADQLTCSECWTLH